LLRLNPSHRSCLYYLLPLRVRVNNFQKYRLPWCDGRCVQDPRTYSPRHSDTRLLAIPPSWSRVAETNPNYEAFTGFAQSCLFASYCNFDCNTCVAQPIRAMST